MASEDLAGLKAERDELRGLIAEVLDHPRFDFCDCGKTHCLTYRLRAAISPAPPQTAELTEDQVPAADTIIRYSDGSFGPLMWHFATEGENFKAILEEQGFEHCRVDMADELEADNPIMEEYDQGDAGRAIREWQPPQLDGWKLVAKCDSEDGPVAHYIRPTSAGSPHAE